jgi:dipeptidyl aminopeptidase/acylaminoacyl peptidase
MRAFLLAAASLALLSAADPKPYFSDPCPSPDGSEIAFVSGGDIWTVPSKGGEARLLVSHPATESRPMYSPDGRRLAFISTRTGNGDVYVLTFATGELKRLTFSDSLDQLDGWSRDGRWIYFSSSAADISGMFDVFRVKVDGGTPMPVAADRYASEYFSAPAPDGQALAITARGIVNTQWWRKGHSHLDESEIWLVHDAVPPRYERVSQRPQSILCFRSRRRAEYLDPHSCRRQAPAGDPFQRWACPLARHLERRPRHHLRARLRHLEARHRKRPGGAGPH